MKICAYCQKQLKGEDQICEYCGYDPKTDTISPVVSKKAEPKRERSELKEGTAFGPKIKIFAILGLLIIAFVIFHKYNFDLNVVYSEAMQFVADASSLLPKHYRGIVGKRMEKMRDDKINAVKAHKPQYDGKNPVLEGIMFVPAGKSFAIINGKVLSEGDTYAGIRVDKINKDSVAIMFKEDVMVLKVLKKD